MKQKDVFWFWLPLFASWLLMTAEGPFISMAINRLPDEVIMLAAQGIIVSLSVTIESPIINLLATSTALVKDRASYEQVRRFTIHWMIGLTVVTVLVAFTPLFDLLVVRLLGTPEAVAVWVRPGMQIMTLWSAAIAWRRFLQGVLIGFNQPKKMAWGTAVRLSVGLITILLLVLFTNWPGVIVGTSALMAAVISEAIFASVAIRPLLQTNLAADAPTSANPLSYGDLFWFHLPLAATSLLVLLVQPLVTFSLARLDRPTDSLAAWPVLFQLMLMARAAALAFPEAVIALTKGPETYQPIRRFALTMSLVTTGFLALFTFSPLADWYLFTVQDMTTEVGGLARNSLLYFLLFPGLTTIAFWLRGMLINKRLTRMVNVGMVANMGVTAVILLIGLGQQWPGLLTAAVALTVALIVEIAVLASRVRQKIPVGLPLPGWLTTKEQTTAA